MTLLAILPAVTLASATITSSSYGYKTLENFKYDRYFWGLIFLFLIDILIPYSYKIYNIQDLRILASIELTAFLSFLFIIPYFLATFNNIIFERIMEKFVNKINRNNLIQSSFKSAQSMDVSKDDASFNVFNMLIFTIKNRDLVGFSIVMEKYSQKIQIIINDLRKKPLKKHPIKDDGLEKFLNAQGLESHYTGQIISNIANNVIQNHIEDISNVAFNFRDERILIDIVKNIEFLTTNTWNDLKSMDYPTNDVFWINGTIRVTMLGEKACSYDMPDLIARCLDSQSNIGIFWAKNPPNRVSYFTHKNYSWNCQLNIKKIFDRYIAVNRRHIDFIVPRVLYNNAELLTMRLIYQPQEIYSNDFDQFESIIKDIVNNNIRGLFIDFEPYFEKLLIPILISMESEKDANKTNTLIELIITLFGLLGKIVVECNAELLKNKKRQDNSLILNYNPKEWYTQLINTISNCFYLSIKCNYLSQLTFFDLYKRLLIIFIRIEEWEKVEELIIEVNKLNKWLKNGNNLVINPVFLFDQILYVLLRLNKSELFIKTVNYLEAEASTNTKISLIAFRILASIGTYCQKWGKNQELLKIITSMLNVSLNKPELEKELDNIQESYHFSLDEGYFLIHTISVSRKEIFSNGDKLAFKKMYYLEKIKRAKLCSDRIKTITDTKTAKIQSNTLKQIIKNKTKNKRKNLT